jgi:hypothetical protein
VDKVNSTVAITGSRNFTTTNGTIVFQATVTGVGATPTGSISFQDGVQFLGTAPLVNGVATLTTSLGSLGTHAVTASYAGDVTFRSSASAPFVAEIVVPNHAYVAQLYLDLLHRQVDSGGLAFWLASLAQGATRAQVAEGIEASPEYRGILVEEMYQRYLQRQADVQGKTYFVSLLLAGATQEQVEADIISSEEYFSRRAGGSNDAFLTSVYGDVLGRGVDPLGSGFFSPILDGTASSRSAVASMILNSAESDSILTQDYYQSFLHRDADSAGLSFWVAALQQGARREQVLAAILASDEYFSRL